MRMMVGSVLGKGAGLFFSGFEVVRFFVFRPVLNYRRLSKTDIFVFPVEG